MGDTETLGTRGNTISLTPRALILIIVTSLGLAGGGSSLLTGIFHGSATSQGQDNQAVQIAVLQTKVTTIESRLNEIIEGQREQTEMMRHLIVRESEDHGRKER